MLSPFLKDKESPSQLASLARKGLQQGNWVRFIFPKVLSTVCNWGDLGLISGLGRSPGEEHGK